MIGRVLAGALLTGMFAIAPAHADLPAPPGGATPVPVTAGRTTSGINAALGAGGSISGRLLDKATGRPATAPALEVAALSHGTTFVGVTTPDDQGRFTISGLPASSRGYAICTGEPVEEDEPVHYAAQCFPHAYTGTSYAVSTGATRVPLAANQHKSIGDITLTPGAAILGLVHAPSGKRLFSVTVVAHSLGDAGLTVESYGGTDPQGDGQYYLDGLPPSTKGWRVCFDGSNAGPKKGGSSHKYLTSCLPKVTVGTGATKRGVNGKLKVAGSITGRVVAAANGAPIAEAQIQVYNPSGHVIAYEQTGEHGRYTVNGLHAKKNFRVCVDGPLSSNRQPANGYLDRCYRSSAWTPGNPPPPSARHVPVHLKATTTGINVALTQGATIDGTITRADGHPVRNASVEVFAVAGRQLRAAYALGSPTGKNGHYHLSGMRAGTYVVCADHFENRHAYFVAPACYRTVAWNGADATVPSSAPHVHLAAHAHRKGIDIVLPAAGMISGTVTSAATGKGLVDDIAVYDRAGNLILPLEQSDQDGRYTIYGLALSTAGYVVCFPSGAYSDLSGTDDSGPFVGQCYDNKEWTG